MTTIGSITGTKKATRKNVPRMGRAVSSPASAIPTITSRTIVNPM